jgi:hypothetical protein
MKFKKECVKMYKKLMLVFIIFICGHLFAEEYSGSNNIKVIETQKEEIDINWSTFVHVKWQANTLLGEPVFNNEGFVVIDYSNYYPVTYKGKTYDVPYEVIDETDVISVNVKWAVKPSIYLDMDLGATGDIYYGTPHSLSRLSKEEKQRYFSFNVPGSPEWGSSFYTKGSSNRKKYFKADESKKIFIEGLSMVEWDSVAEVEFDLSPVKNWIENSIKNKEGKTANKKAEKEELGKINNKIGGKTVNKHLSTQKKEDPFKKFDNMNSFASDENLEKIDGEIGSFIIKRCGMYYTDVRQGLTLSRGNVSEEKKKEAARKRRRDKLNMLPGLQKKWKEKRESIKDECRTYIIKKYSFEVSTEKLEELLTDNFTSTEKFSGIYHY